MATSAGAKPPRSLNSASPALESGYLKFLDFVFESRPNSVAREETSAHRAIVLADSVRIVCSKKTGMLRSDVRMFEDGISGAAPKSAWSKRVHFPIEHFWVSRTELARAINGAWVRQITRFIPAAAECYPQHLPKRLVHNSMTAEHLRDMYIGLAAERRLGNRIVRGQALNVFIGGLWNFLVDRETLNLCHAYFGRKASLDDYNLTVRFRDELRARAAEAQSLTPLMGMYIKEQLPKFLKSKVLGSDLLAAARKRFFDTSAVDTCVPSASINFYEEPRDYLLAPENLSPAAWRFLSHRSRHNVAYVIELIRRESEGPRSKQEAAHRIAARLNGLVRTGEQPPFLFLKWTLENLGHLEVSGESAAGRKASTANLYRFLLHAARQAILERKQGTLKRFLRTDLVLAWDWLGQRDGGGGRRRRPAIPCLANVPRNATWASIVRAEQEWHGQRAAREEARRRADLEAYRAHQAAQAARTWKSTAIPSSLNGVAIKPLVSGGQLQEEGIRMDHCVADYVDSCVKGQSRIFSLQEGDEFATVELFRGTSRKWQVRQVFGPDNSEVPKSFHQVAKQLARLYRSEAAGSAGTPGIS